MKNLPQPAETQATETPRVDPAPAAKTVGGHMIGKQVIVRTYSAGCWFGTLVEKDRDEVILADARRLWSWEAGGNGICLSAIAVHGVVASGSRISEPVMQIWLAAIEIIPCTIDSILSISSCPPAARS